MSETTPTWKECRSRGETWVYYTRDRYRLHFSTNQNLWVLKVNRKPFKELACWEAAPSSLETAQAYADTWLMVHARADRPEIQEVPTNPAFTPEPPPQDNGGIEVWPHLIRTLRDPGNAMFATISATPEGAALYGRWTDAMQARHEDGVRKYGKPLTTNNGRRALVDSMQESLDGIVYNMQADLQGELEEACGLLMQNKVLDGTLQQLRTKIAVDARMLSFLLFAMVDAVGQAKKTQETP